MEFIKKHTAVFLSLFSVMSAAVIFLGAYALVDLSGEKRKTVFRGYTRSR